MILRTQRESQYLKRDCANQEIKPYYSTRREQNIYNKIFEKHNIYNMVYMNISYSNGISTLLKTQ